jgi:tRNA(His) guanylyltransferase
MMKFDELDDRMRVFETTHDLCVLPGLYMVARLDGRSFTRLTKEVHQFEAPFDARFRDLMLATAEHLMTGCGFTSSTGTPRATKSPCCSPWRRTASTENSAS